MVCTICVDNQSFNDEDLPDDCILRFIEQIKKHYLTFQDKLLTEKFELQKLKVKNQELSSRVNFLETQIKESATGDPKRRKTSSLERINSAEKEENDLLLLKNTKSFTSHESTKSKDLKILGHLAHPTSCSPEKDPISNRDVPKRCNKESRNNNNKENQNNEKNKEWISKDFHKKKDFKSPPNRKWNMSFVQPTSTTKLKQTTLNLKSFKTPVKSEPLSDDDVIAASPTCDNTNSSDISKKKSIKDNLNFIVNKSEETKSKKYVENNPSTSMDLVIPGSPVKSKKRLPLSPRKHNVSYNQNQNSNSSMSSTHSDDVLCIDDVDVPYDITCSVLLEEMMNMSDSIPLKLKLAEEKRIKKLKDRQDEVNKKTAQRETDKTTSTKTNEDHNQEVLPIEINCPDCEMYFKIFGVPSSREEIERRINKCKNHKNAEKFNETPDGFWDPIFRQFPDDDPRNETLIDTRFIDKKN